MKSEYLMGFVVVGTVAFLVLVVWVPMVWSSRRNQRNRMAVLLTTESDDRARVLYLLNKVNKK